MKFTTKFTDEDIFLWIRESNAIEGYDFTLEEVERVITHVRTSEALEKPCLIENPYIIDHYKAIMYIKGLVGQPIKMHDVYMLHFLLMNNLLESAGSLRSIHVTVGGELCPRPPYILPYLDRWHKMHGQTPAKSWAKKKVCFFRHCEFEFIHPFVDGNGRVGRLLYLWDSLNNNLCTEVIFADEKLAYYQKLIDYKNTLRVKYLDKWS